MGVYNHAKRELNILVKQSEKDNRPIVEEFIPEILQLCKKFGESGQSGGSAPYTSNAITQTLKKLFAYLPICPITGIDDEWSLLDYYDNLMYQNNRCSAIFKTESRTAHYLDAIVWQGEDDYDAFTGSVEGISSEQNVKFPFEPKTFYIDVKKEYLPEDWNEEPFIEDNYMEDGKIIKNNYRYVIKDKSQLKQVAEYYDVGQEFIDFMESN